MSTVRLISGMIGVGLLTGCASLPGAEGPRGPKLVGSGQSTMYEQYAEVGVEFSSVGDFVALLSPNRWKSPMATGGSLSWMNLDAWREDPGRTGRIIMGQAVVLGGVAAASGGGGGGSGSSEGGAGGDGIGSVIGGPPSIPSSTPE